MAGRLNQLGYLDYRRSDARRLIKKDRELRLRLTASRGDEASQQARSLCGHANGHEIHKLDQRHERAAISEQIRQDHNEADCAAKPNVACGTK